MSLAVSKPSPPPMARRARLALAPAVGLCLAVAAACSARQTPARGQPSSAASTTLRFLPAASALRWVKPSALIADATSEDEASATLGAAHSMRLDVETVLKGARWSIVSADSAPFSATIAIVQRTRFEEERRVIPGTEAVAQRCTGRSCPPPPPPRYQMVTVQRQHSRAVLVVRRRDGARFEYALDHVDPKSSGGAFAKQIITLLRAR